MSFPIDAVLPELGETLRNHPSAILHAPPGAGKTTRVPLALLGLFPAGSGRIVMLEPRRIAAVTAARWMSKCLHEQTGETVGYAVRFDARISAKTRVEVVTEGVLTRRIQSDPALKNTALVIFDEFHERSIHSDLALALCLDIRMGLRPDLRILVMSATLDCGPVASLLGEAPIITSAGKTYPVEERYSPGVSGVTALRTAGAIKTAVRETEGDILAFLPGSGEIRACERELREAFASADEGISLHALYGDLPFEEQERAIVPSKDRRKIVLATNIAETSLTIEGVRVVIDSGLTRTLRYDPATGMNRLVTMPVSQSSAEQRKGRAGRLGPGVCYRLFSRQELSAMLPFAKPEILTSDLSQLVLELAAWGVKDPRMLSWLDVPPTASWESGLRLLQNLGAVDSAGSVTALGRDMVRLPLHPRLSRILIRAKELGCLHLGADLAALLTGRDVYRSSAGGRIVIEPDITDRLDALRGAGRGGDSGVIDASALRAVVRTSKQLLRLIRGADDDDNHSHTDQVIVSRLLLAAFSDMICKRREEGIGHFVHSQGRGVRLSPESHLIGSPYLIAVSADAGENTEGFIHLAAPVTEETIRQECGARIVTFRGSSWDRKEGRVVAAAEERLGSLVLSRKPYAPSDEEASPLVCEAVRTEPGLIVFGNDARQFRARVDLMRRTFPEETWPDLSDERLFSSPEEWLLPWLGGVRSVRDLARVNFLQALKATLTREQLHFLNERTPLTILVPSGNRASVDYAKDETPILAVKLQEMFGLADTPRIADGRVTMLLHLLSPAGRPVQVTRDLKGFWNNVYPEVRKNLKGRYPKHPWPDDPWTAVPTRRTKSNEHRNRTTPRSGR